MSASEIIVHIRRDDEVNVTHCGELTEYDAVITNTPVTVGAHDLAIFADVEAPAGSSNCGACWTAYSTLGDAR